MKSLLNPEAGAKLEKFSSTDPKFPELSQKMDLALLLLGVKKATTWIIFSKPHSSPKFVPGINSKVLRETLGFLRGLALIAEPMDADVVKNAKPPTPYTRRQVILIARTPNNLELNRKLWQENTKHRAEEGLGGYPHDDALYGELAGFPTTAIKAFLSGDGLSAKDIPREVKQTPAYAFAMFKLSRSHWQQELEISAQWAEEVRKSAPALYDDIVESRRLIHKG